MWPFSRKPVLKRVRIIGNEFTYAFNPFTKDYQVFAKDLETKELLYTFSDTLYPAGVGTVDINKWKKA